MENVFTLHRLVELFGEGLSQVVAQDVQPLYLVQNEGGESSLRWYPTAAIYQVVVDCFNCWRGVLDDEQVEERLEIVVNNIYSYMGVLSRGNTLVSLVYNEQPAIFSCN